MDQSSNGHVLSRDEILGSQDRVIERVPVREWKGTVLVCSLTSQERDYFEAQSREKRGEDYEVNWRNLRARLVSLSVVDEQGNKIFSKADIEALGEKNSAAVNKVFEAAQRVSGLTKDQVEDLVKNSEPAPGDSLHTAS